MVLGFAIYNYNTGSALIAYGLSAKQALAAGILSPIVLVIMCILCGVSLAAQRRLLVYFLSTWIMFVGTDSSIIQHSGPAEHITSPSPCNAVWLGACEAAGSPSSSE